MNFMSNVTRQQYKKFISDYQSPLRNIPSNESSIQKAFVFVDDKGVKFLADVMDKYNLDDCELFALGLEKDGPMEMLVIG